MSSPHELSVEDVQDDPQLAGDVLAATTAEHTLVCMIFDEKDGFATDAVHHDRFEYDGRDWFILHNDTDQMVEPGGQDVPPGKTRLIVDSTNLAKMHQNETGWMYDPDTGEPINAASVYFEHSGGGDEGNAIAKTWMLRTIGALRVRFAEVSGYDLDEFVPIETMLQDSCNRLQNFEEGDSS